jgi:hypothetical protein
MQVENNNPKDDADVGVEIVLEEAEAPAGTKAEPDGSAEADKGAGAESQGAPVGEAQGGDDELENYSDSVKRRIAKLTGKMREAERREQAAIEYAKAVKAQQEADSKKLQTVEGYHLREYAERLKAQEVVLNTGLAQAIESGNTAKQIEAQKALADLAYEKRTYASMEAQRQNAAAARQAQPQQQAPQPQQAPPPMPDAKAQAWANRNGWFGQDEAMTVTAFAHHKKLVEQEGVDPTSDDYYRELDKRMRSDFPHKFQKASPAPNTVAPAVRTAPQAGNKTKDVVKLSPSQVAIAKKLGVTLEQYARQVAKLNREG